LRHIVVELLLRVECVLLLLAAHLLDIVILCLLVHSAGRGALAVPVAPALSALAASLPIVRSSSSYLFILDPLSLLWFLAGWRTSGCASHGLCRGSAQAAWLAHGPGVHGVGAGQRPVWVQYRSYGTRRKELLWGGRLVVVIVLELVCLPAW
jgi:hypothetical protein